MIHSSLIFAAFFLAGVACGVYVIVRGVERPGAPATGVPRVDAFGREVGTGSISVRAAVAAATLVSIGLVGYVGTRVLDLSVASASVLGIAVAVVMAPVSARHVRRWAERAAAEAATDPRYVLQGHVARVIHGATSEERAQVAYTANGQRVVAPAECIDHSALVAGTDVVIDRVDAGVVYVEPWTRVEQRL